MWVWGQVPPAAVTAAADNPYCHAPKRHAPECECATIWEKAKPAGHIGAPAGTVGPKP